MVVDRSEFAELMAHVQTGSQDAARRLYEMYGRHVLRVVRRKLHRRLRTQYDSGDLLQAIWASFFAIPLDGQMFEGPEQLVDFLCTIAANKSAQLFRKRMMCQRYNLNREEHLEDLGPWQQAMSDGYPTPSQFVVADDCWDALLRGKPPLLQKMLLMLRAGHSYQEIAEQTGLRPKTIQRHLQRLTRVIRR